jgi:hypothetical protein
LSSVVLFSQRKRIQPSARRFNVGKGDEEGSSRPERDGAACANAAVAAVEDRPTAPAALPTLLTKARLE